MADDREIARLFRVNKTIHELVDDRGFQVSEEEKEMSFDNFKKTFAPNGSVDRNSLNFWTNSRTDPEDSIFVFYSDEKKVGVKTMRKFIGILDDKKIRRGIIIYADAMSPPARKVITQLGQDYTLEEYPEADLLVNITKHNLVPRHEVLPKEEKAALLLRYRLRETQLPRILISDPVARYYGLVRGQVVKITRPSETAGRYCTFRIVL
ncbi:DNA-directed RNA polymerase RPB5 subunit [Mrakia frigida]|uniref:DNA-directed RNA polymerase core subunit RPB5 n=1 Tax=Mrakia frigida TaxID=29902 RepID=UPI003FCC1A95